MSLSTSHRFFELQIMIWEFAASSSGLKRDCLHHGFLGDVHRPRWSTKGSNYFYQAFIRVARDWAHKTWKTEARTQLATLCYKMRETLMKTCHLSRKASLETWKRDILRIPRLPPSSNGVVWDGGSEMFRAKILAQIDKVLSGGVTDSQYLP